MYSTLDKALVALVMGIIGVIQVMWHPVNISQEAVTTIIGVLTPVLVYVWPNAPKDSK